MAQPTWVTVVVGVGSGVIASTVAAFLNRNAATRAWERGRLADAYVAVNEALFAMADAIVASKGIYSTTPVGDTDEAWRGVDTAHGALMHVVLTARMLGSDRSSDVLTAFVTLDTPALAPAARASGVAPPAFRRFSEEQRWFGQLMALATLHMRADLRFSSVLERRRLRQATRRAFHHAPQRLSVSTDPDELSRSLREYGVLPLVGDAPPESYAASPAETVPFLQPFPVLHDSVALVVRFPASGLVRAGVVELLAPNDYRCALQAILQYVETGFRVGPGYRDGPNGSRVSAWSQQSLRPVLPRAIPALTWKGRRAQRTKAREDMQAAR